MVNALQRALTLRMSAANWFEAAMVVDSRPDIRLPKAFDDLILSMNVHIVPIDAAMAAVARAAHQRFGRGHHPAQLNFGDCFSYALAKSANEPLLFKGNDFSQTDIEAAPY